MKMIAEYLEHAINFERMADREENPEVRAKFLKQATDYRKLAARRAAQIGLPEPPPRQSD